MVGVKLFLIAKNNIKKAKAATATIILLVSMATIFLYVGISVVTQIDHYIDEKNLKYNGAHEIVIASREQKEEIRKIYEETEGFSQMEVEDAMMFSSSKLQNMQTAEEKYAMPTLFLDRSKERAISKIDIIDEAKEPYENGIIVPYVLKVSNGYQTGDRILIYLGKKTIEFKIAGFYEDVMFSSPTNLMLYKFFINENQLQELEEIESGIPCSVNLAILKNSKDSIGFENQILAKIKTEIGDTNHIYLTGNYLSLKTGASVFTLIIMSVLIAFSGVILLISMIVIRFSTVTHIEGNIKNIGTMEACGYTAGQLIRSTLLEYGIMATIGYSLGLIVSLIITPLVTKIVSSSIGLNWEAKSSSIAIIISFAVIMSLIMTISYISGAKFKKITPLSALRNGIETHNFKKNKIPLDQTRFNVNLAISMKEFFFHKRQNIVAGIIIMLLSVVCVLALAMYYNFVVDNTAMTNLVGIEDAEIEVVLPNDTKRIYEEISNKKEVKKITKLESFQTTVHFKEKESNPNFHVTDDFNTLQINTLVKGKFPQHDNEISMTSLILDEIGAKLGDTVSVEYNNISKEFLVVGITQHISYLGRGAELTTAGMKRLVKDYEGTTAMIYLENQTDSEEFITELSNTYKAENIQVKNNKETLDNMMITFRASIRIISIVCLIIAGIIITFIMFLIVRARVMKEKKHIGISKALGYTSNQLISHILISQVPVIIVSSILGSIAGYYLTNPMIALSLAGNGILKCNFFIPSSVVIVTPVGISILGFLTVMFVSLKIRKISPIMMLGEENS